MASPNKFKRRTTKKSKEIVINENLLYSERNIWSPSFKAWTRYRVSKPRLPCDADSGIRWVEDTSNYPRNFASFIGHHNDAMFAQIKGMQDMLETAKTLPELIIICGPSGSGKSAIASIFSQNLVDILNLNSSQSSKFCLTINASQYRKDYNTLWIKINRFADTNFEKFLNVRFRLIVIDNMATISPSNQQELKKIMEAQSTRLKFILICDDPKSQLLTYLHTRATIFKAKQIPERDALMVILSYCNKNSIGFNLDGIRKLFSIHSNISITNIMDLLQKVFLQRHFISEENVAKVSGVGLDKPTISPAQTLEPLSRCDICTLYPPCKHMTLEVMTVLGQQRRDELPRYKTGSMNCPEFIRSGNCSMFNLHGHCSLDHPKDVHIIITPPAKCATCTIPWPCNHCSYTQDRINLMTTIREIQSRITRSRQINVPDPPRSLIRHLREYSPDWAEQLAQIVEKYVIPTKLALLNETEQWVNTQMSVLAEEYRRKNRLLLVAFDEFHSTLLLERPSSNATIIVPSN
mmetsp:Transcript_10784/g.14841  ORF Transcript_10784/g.14841 Transcript_10784/m.14841 type:complete len:521 (+) Transcript_10784:18-1580(+)